MSVLRFANLERESIKLVNCAGLLEKFFELILYREIAENHGYTVCELFSGHGIGELLHMPPLVHHVGKKKNRENILHLKR